MGHGDDHDLIDRELLGKPAKPSRRHLRRSMHGCPAQLLDSLLLSRRKRAGSELGGSGKGPVEGAVAIKPPMRTRKKEALGPFRGRCGVDPYAQACQRSRAISARLEGRAIGIARFCATVAVVKEVCIAIGQPELRGELRGQRRAAEKPWLWRGCPERLRADPREGMVVRHRLPSRPGDHVGKVAHEGIWTCHHQRMVHHGRLQRIAGLSIGPGTVANSEIDASRRQCVEDTELLRNLQWCIVRQRDAGAADAHRARDVRQRAEPNLRRRACDSVVVVMLRDPEPVVAEFLACTRKRKRFADRRIWRPSRGNTRLIEDREAHQTCSTRWQRQTSATLCLPRVSRRWSA